MLWDCCYVKSLWKIVEIVCGIEISFGKVLGTEDCNGYDHVLTLFFSSYIKSGYCYHLRVKLDKEILRWNFTKMR